MEGGGADVRAIGGVEGGGASVKGGGERRRCLGGGWGRAAAWEEEGWHGWAKVAREENVAAWGEDVTAQRCERRTRQHEGGEEDRGGAPTLGGGEGGAGARGRRTRRVGGD